MVVPGKGNQARRTKSSIIYYFWYVFEWLRVFCQRQWPSNENVNRRSISFTVIFCSLKWKTELNMFVCRFVSWTDRMVKEIAVGVFCLKVVRYAIYLWLPLYFKQEVRWKFYQQEVSTNDEASDECVVCSWIIQKQTLVFSRQCSKSVASLAVQRLEFVSKGYIDFHSEIFISPSINFRKCFLLDFSEMKDVLALLSKQWSVHSLCSCFWSSLVQVWQLILSWWSLLASSTVALI